MKSVVSAIARTACLVLLVKFLVACGGAPASGGNTGTGGAGTGGTGTDGAADPTIQIGRGGGSSFTAGALSANLINGGTSASWQVNAVVADTSGIAVTEMHTITFSSTCITASLSSLSAVSVDTVAGRASTTYTVSGCTGVDTLIATVATANGDVTASVDLNIDVVAGAGDGGGGSSASPQLGSVVGGVFMNGDLIASRTTLDAGGSSLISASLIDTDGNAITEPASIIFSSNCVSTGLSSFSAETVTASGGFAATTYLAEGCAGDDTVTARAIVGGVSLSATVDLMIQPDTVLGVQFESASETRLAIKGIGGQESAVVTFRLVGAQGAPIVGEQVAFRISNAAGGTQLAEGADTDESNNDGLVSTVVQSGTVNSTFRVEATHVLTGRQGSSRDITVSTGVVVDRSFEISYDPFNPAAANTNGVPVRVTVNASDQFGNPPPDGARVSFRSPEVGTIEPFCELINGECFVTWESSGDRGAITPDVDGRGYRATIIAFMTGAEDFVDFNGNGFFDPDNANEVASHTGANDLPEAFVDQNENGSYDAGENFVDSFRNNPVPSDGVPGGINQVYDAADGEYNGPCSSEIRNDCPESSLQSTIVSDTAVIVLSSNVPAFCDSGTLPPVNTSLSNDISQGFTLSGVIMCDVNRNSLPNGTTIVWGATNASIEPAAATTTTVPIDATEPILVNTVSVRSLAGQTRGLVTLTVSPPTGTPILYTWSWGTP